MKYFIIPLKNYIKKQKLLAGILYRIYLQSLFTYRAVQAFITKYLIHFLTALVVKDDIEELAITHKGATLKYYGKSFYWNPADRTSLLGIAFTGSYESKELKKILEFIQPGMSVFDIGGNYGLHAILMGEKAGEKGCVYTFEPLKHIFKELQKNIDLNGFQKNVIPENIALSNTSGKAAIYVSPALGSGASSLKIRWKGENIKYMCILATLDSYVLKHKINQVDFIKCDVEGAEYLAFQGAKKTLQKCKPILFFEAIDNHTKLFSYTIEEEMNYLKQFSYDFFLIDKNGLEKVSTFSNGNYFALTPKHREQFGI